MKQPVLIIWDVLKAHRSRLGYDYFGCLGVHIQIVLLQPYASDLNPVEYLWAWLKPHVLANCCLADFGELRATARDRLKSIQKLWMQATQCQCHCRGTDQ